MKVTLADEALADIIDALSYLDERNPTAATKLNDDVQRCIERLAAGEFEGPRAPVFWCNRPKLASSTLPHLLQASFRRAFDRSYIPPGAAANYTLNPVHRGYAFAM